MMKKHWIIGLELVMMFCSCGQPDTKAYLKKVIENLESIESVEYQCRHIYWNGYVKEPIYDVIELCHEYANPKDTIFGSCYAEFIPEEGMRFDSGYDGNVKMTVYEEDKDVMIDDFTAEPMDFRPVNTFFNCTKNIFKYIIETTDSIETTLMDEDSCYHLKLTVHEDRTVNFFGKPVYFKPGPNMGIDSIFSQYDVWIRKADNLPYKYEERQAETTYIEECINPVYNKLSLADFNLYDYIPEGYNVFHKRPRDLKKEAERVYTLQDKPAPQWTLTDIEDRPVSLADIKSKVILLNFTGIGCGACQAAIPFLKELKTKYAPEDFELIAIESWSGKTSSRKGYSEKKELNYLFLGATEEVLKDYQTGRAAPWFFLLDENRIIRKIFWGYSEARTGKEIEEAIDRLLK